MAPGRDREPDAKGHRMVEGFVTASLLYCVGAMAVIGSIKDGTGDPSVLYVKSLLDGIASIALASTFGIGVALSVIPVLVYQGGITLAASAVAPFLTLPVLSTLTAVGGMLIAAIGLDIIGIKRLPVGNLLPAVFVAARAGVLLRLNPSGSSRATANTCGHTRACAGTRGGRGGSAPRGAGSVERGSAGSYRLAREVGGQLAFEGRLATRAPHVEEALRGARAHRRVRSDIRRPPVS